ncbi:MAG: hypothetical protein M1828_006649 [Chrysothrix sp. TS-e1954]|nr:MAG: hypothetical protein M1828_006649 [Chrysothrix sp. TS-e1954]
MASASTVPKKRQGSASESNEASSKSQSTPTDETTGLLAKTQSEADPWPTTKTGFRTYAAELWLLFKASLPVILAYTLQNSLQTVSVIIVGRLSPESLATAAFAYMFAMATGWLIALGGTTAIDTLASASFTGSENPHDLGIILQRAFLVLTSLYVPVVILWFCSEPLFLALGQEAYIARDASKFLMVLAPGGLGYIYFECLKKYLQAQEIMRPGTYVLLITSPLNALLNWLCVYPLGMGLLGAPLATGVSYWLSFVLLVLYARFVAGSKSWGGFSRQCMHHAGSFAKLAILGVVHIGTEWWAFEIVALVAGRLGTIPLAAQSVIMTTDQVMNTIPFGVGVAASARVGNQLGARHAQGAKRAANTAAVLSMILGLVVLSVLMGVKDVYARLFNDDERVVKLTADVMPYVAFFQIADGLNGSCGGALRGMGRQHVGAAVNVLSYYAGALPLGIWLAFHGWGLAGLWVGQCCALYLVGIVEWIIVAWSNWEKQVERAFERMEAGDDVNADANREGQEQRTECV